MKLRRIDEQSVHFDSNLEFSHFQYYEKGPVVITLELKDRRFDLRSLKPIASSATLSSGGKNYFVKFSPERTRYNGSSYDPRDGTNFYLSFDFSVFSDQEMTHPLVELPQGVYNFSVSFTGIPEVRKISGQFRLRDEWHEYHDGLH